VSVISICLLRLYTSIAIEWLGNEGGTWVVVVLLDYGRL
jgi:hypothetical protein